MTFSFAPISLGHTKPQDELDEALKGDQHKLDHDKDGDIDAKDFAMLRSKKKKKKNEDEPEGDNGETATMNPKMGTTKEGKSEFGMASDIVQKHSKNSEVRGSGDGTTVTAEHPKGQNATKDERMAHTNMVKDKLKHLKSVNVVHKTYPGSATEQNVKEYGMVYSNKQTHMFDNEKDARAKAKQIGGKYVKGTGKSAGKHAAIKEGASESVGKTPGDDSYHNLQKAKRMASADGHDYDKLPAYDRTNNKHKDYYDNKAKNEGVNEKDHVEKDGNMSIREKLINVVERANHGNMDSKETYDDMYKGAGAKKMRKDHQNMKVDTTRALGVDDASKAARVGKKAPMRSADNAKGDTNIVPAGTPMKDPSASKDTALESVMAAYKSMNKE